MPEDKRLWMPFPNDFWLHPKIIGLSDNAFRAFVEMVGYSRINDLDGRIPLLAANAKWRKRSLVELQANHPERPTLSVDGDAYVIWNYSEHQETRAKRGERTAIATANGSKGGRPKGNQTRTQLVSEMEPKSNQSQSLEIDRPRLIESSQVPDAPPVDLMKIIAAVNEHCGRQCSKAQAFLIIGTVMSRARTRPKNQTGFVTRAIVNDPFEFQKLLDESGAVEYMSVPHGVEPAARCSVHLLQPSPVDCVDCDAATVVRAGWLQTGKATA